MTTGSTITSAVVTFDPGVSARNAAVTSFKLRQNIEWIEYETIRRAMAVSTAKRQAARLMGISPRALSYYLAKYPNIGQNLARRRPTTAPVSELPAM
jgi:transcriptional regulator with GAF, ATPase, and Fis domain